MKSVFKINNLFHQRKIQKKKILFAVSIFIIITAIGFSFLLIKNHQKSQPSQKNSTDVVMQKANSASLGDFYLKIPKLNLASPIITDVDGTNKDVYFKALENGVAQMKGTAKPGEESNTLIFGHSSYYKDSPGNYKEIFKNIDQIKIGDEISIHYNNKDFGYLVTETKTVENNDVSIASISGQERITLMTCWPAGTTDKRYVVIAEPKK
jgi:LPXTG-site transpeptidase (sortase) family protein